MKYNGWEENKQYDRCRWRHWNGARADTDGKIVALREYSLLYDILALGFV